MSPLKLLLLSALFTSCLDPSASAEEQRERAQDPLCPSARVHQGPLPHTQALHDDPDYWMETWASHFTMDEALLSPAEVSAHNQALGVQSSEATMNAQEPTLPSPDSSEEGGEATQAKSETAPHTPKFTRREVLKRLFTQRGASLTSGDPQDQVSARFITDLLAPFGMKMPSSLGAQVRAGTFSVDLTKITSRGERENILNTAFKRGLTLIYTADHAMVYLGADQGDTARVIHALVSYPEPCNREGGETSVEVNRVVISDLSLGGGSSAKDLLSRATHVVVIGGDPGPGLRLVAQGGLAQFRQPAPLKRPPRSLCRRTRNRARIFTSPRIPNARQPTRLMITRPHRDTPAQVTLYGPDQAVITPALTRLGGPPFIYYSEPIKLARGQWRIAYGEGDDLHACTHVEVERRPKVEASEDYIWEPEAEWSEHTEALYAGFVERLFQYPIEEDRSWTNLQDLLMVEDHNLLYQHLSSSEESKLKLQPDCADLPYTLRAYFAWKMGLPFSYMTCTRGSKKKPPRCQDRQDSHQERGRRSVGADFQWFARRRIAGHVHSSSARTVPGDEETELYPVALNHKTLRPGIVFADPYGHLLLIAGWLPQPTGGYGVLIGADAQPDGTIGRRRFWQGSFLFDPDHELVGAGFKSFRPLVRVEPKPCKDEEDRGAFKKKRKKKRRRARCKTYPKGSAGWRPVSNEGLRDAKWGALQWSDQQYRGSKRRFYDVMEGLISPRPLAAKVQLLSLADALHESARRRVLSVNNGEEWIRTHPRRKMKMPSGYSIFLTTGPWEDFATPSRDMRLLIALDTVLDIPAAVRRDPKRFGISPSELDREIKTLKETLKSALTARTFEYTKSDGTPQTISLWDLAERAEALEMAYNPNDCVEVRWGAPKESEERATCKRAAPRAQVRKMKRYRAWFHDRRRPPRGTR